MLNHVLPKRGAFFALLNAHTERVVGGANATMRLISGLGNQVSSSDSLIEEVNLNEQSADAIKAEFIQLLYESFTTPMNRDQLHTLILDLDRVLDTLQSAANALRMYHISNSTPTARSLAAMGADACLHLSRAVANLADRNAHETILSHCREIEKLENDASHLMREAIGVLFAREGDEAAAWWAMKLRRLYFTQAAVIDGCKRAAHTLEEILIENN